MLQGLFQSRTRRRLENLSEREILALAIGAEEEDGRIYRDMADRVAPGFPATADIFQSMAAEEDEHRHLLLAVYRQRFGEHIPLVKRADIQGFYLPEPVWLLADFEVERLWQMAERIEAQNRRFYQYAAARSQDAGIRKLLGDLAAAEQGHARKARELAATHLTESAQEAEKDESRRQLVLQVVQPGLAGLMDGSVSTLAPLFAAAMATQNSHETFLIGLSAAVGAGISMGFAEALSDDGKLSGRGSPWLRGTVCGAMTALGGLGHTLPYLIDNIRIATGLATVVVALELFAIATIRWKYMQSPFWRAMVQVVLGGALVVAAGILLGGG
jgi:rubrerythrin